MHRASAAGGRKIDLARIRPVISYQFGYRLEGDRWIHRDDERHADNARDRSDIANEIEIKIVVERRVNRGRRTDQKKRVAVRGGTCDRLRADIAAGPGPILNDELLSEPLR